MRAILYGIPFSALLSQVRTTENHLFAQKVLFFCSKKMYNVVGMCSFLLFVGDFRDLSAKFAIAIYPREGTKTLMALVFFAVRLKLQFIPARGRKRVGLICGACSINCNLSPRGDENFLPSRTSKCTQLIAIYPREGTKTGKTGRNLPRTAIAIYPREGTKTSDTRYSRSVMTNCNLSPRGDENARVLTGAGCTEYCNLSPRGDENLSNSVKIISHF